MSGTLTIRRMQRRDAATWQALFASVADEGLWIGTESPVPDWGDAMVAKFVDSETDVMFLAFVDDVAVGWISAEDHDVGRELGMGITAPFRGRGIGSALMDTIIEWAGDLMLVLRVFPHNERARALYRKFGFVELEHKYGVWPRRDGEFWDLIFMQRTPAPI